MTGHPHYDAAVEAEDLVNELARIRDEGERRWDESSQFVGTESRIALYSLVHGRNATARGELLGGLQYLRLLSETVIRMRWAAGDGEEVGDPDGRPLIDATVARARIRSLQKRDLAHLLAAYRAIHIDGNFELAPDLEGMINAIAEPLAPREISGLATSTTGRAAYATHRLCSSMIHPGLGIHRAGGMPRQRLAEMTDEMGYLAAAFGDAMLRTLA